MDGLRKEQFLGTDKYILGDSGTDLVLETLGKVYVKIGNQTKVLSDVLELLDATADTTTTNDITLVNDLSISISDLQRYEVQVWYSRPLYNQVSQSYFRCFRPHKQQRSFHLETFWRVQGKLDEELPKQSGKQ